MSLVEWLQSGPLADSEAESDREGPFSWRGETHAFVTVGVPVGLLFVLSGRLELLALMAGWALRGGKTDLPIRVPYRRQLLAETGYLLSGLAVGAIGGVVARLAIGKTPIPSGLLDLLMGLPL